MIEHTIEPSSPLVNTRCVTPASLAQSCSTATWAVPVSPVHVKHYILRPPLLEPCNPVSCDLPCVLINYSTSPGGISQACRIMDKQNSCQHECCSCKSLKRSCKDTGVSRDPKITSACSNSVTYRCIFVSLYISNGLKMM